MRYITTFVLNNFTTNVIQVLICYGGGLCCLIPLFRQNESNVEGSILRTSITSVGNRYISVATLSLVVPAFLDCISDLFFNSKDGKQQGDKTVAKEGFLNGLEKGLFLSGIVITPIVSFFPESTTNWVLIYICCQKCQQIFIFGSVTISLCRYDNNCWSNKATYVVILMQNLGNIIYQNFTGAGTRIVDTFSVCLVIISVTIFFVCAFRWYIGPFRRKYNVLFRQTQEGSELFFPLVYITMSVISLITLCLLKGFYNRPEGFDETALLVDKLIFLMYILFIIFLSMRMVKSEVVQGLVSDDM